MKILPATILLALVTSLAAAQSISDLPSCANQCFLAALSETTCDLGDFYCQCTKGAEAITQYARQCLCEDSSCSPAELLSELGLRE